jgi:hypothetical protein
MSAGRFGDVPRAALSLPLVRRFTHVHSIP